ncbi:MFS transporter [Deinococcus altitudinis]|uniref:MFS transporter n=1 Tax=Deinococcus altitudinis TaxID=468914 RepID=UPI0038921292
MSQSQPSQIPPGQTPPSQLQVSQAQASLSNADQAPTPTPDVARALLTPRVATSVMFFVNGLAFATWVLHIPTVRDALSLSDAQVGTAILGIAVGSLFSMPLSGRWIVRFGSAAVTRLFALLFLLCLPLPFLAVNLSTLFLALAALGLTSGAMDVAMNAQGVAVERQLKRPVLSSFHAWFSLGNLAGALVGSLLLGAGVSLRGHVTGVLVFTLLALGAAAFSLLPRRFDSQGEEQSGTQVKPPAPPASWVQRLRSRLRLSPFVLSMGLLCFLGMLGEGATGDWSGLYFRDVLGATGGLVGLGYTAFTLAMTLGRTFGDGWRGRFGAAKLVIGGALLSGLGVLLAVLGPGLGKRGWLLAGAGYALTGLGVANIVPVLYGVAGRAMNAQGIAQVATLGYLGFLAGPPLIGYVSHLLNLRAGLLVIAASLLLVAVLGLGVFRRAQPELRQAS